MRSTLFLAAAIVAPGSTLAAETYMWGVGPRIGTHFLPARYPVKLPRDVAADLETCTAQENPCGIDKIWHDFMFGAETFYYLNRHGRMGALLGVDLGPRYSEIHGILVYNYAAHTGPLDLLAGGGVGAGYSWFSGTGNEKLKVATFPFRLETAAMIRDNTRAYQLKLFTQYNLPSSQKYITGSEVNEKPGVGVYLTAGIELSVLFGDFTPPDQEDRKRRGKKDVPVDDAPPSSD